MATSLRAFKQPLLHRLDQWTLLAANGYRERERQRIESKNPNPKMPLVRYVGGTWRVGGILALSRAFGDAYLKGSGQFEGVPSGSDGYGSGFGVVADPTVTLTPLTREQFLVSPTPPLLPLGVLFLPQFQLSQLPPGRPLLDMPTFWLFGCITPSTE